MGYVAKDIARFITVQDTLSHALRDFKSDRTRENQEKLQEAWVNYKSFMPEDVKRELARDEADLEFRARLTLDRYYDAGMAYDK